MNLPLFDGNPVSDKQSLAEIRDELGDCQRCGLCKTRQNIVFGDGNPEAKMMFVGEGPGATEDEQGLPFVGPAGDLLIGVLDQLGVKRADIYISNLVKCRPPKNRDPEFHEVHTCLPFLRAQVRAVNPKVVVSLGKLASQWLSVTTLKVSQLRQRRIMFEGVRVAVADHPAFVLRNPDVRERFIDDMVNAMYLGKVL